MLFCPDYSRFLQSSKIITLEKILQFFSKFVCSKKMCYNVCNFFQVEEMANRQQQIMQHCVGGVNSRYHCIHKWPFLRAKGPRCNQDIIRVMKILQPLLQDAIQKKSCKQIVEGPLTWRQFHRLAGRGEVLTFGLYRSVIGRVDTFSVLLSGTDDRCEPQPIPPVVVGHDKDWLSLAPYTLHYWEKLLLEPYSYSRDVAYIVVAPDNEFVLQKVRVFFKELSSCYEVRGCHLYSANQIFSGVEPRVGPGLSNKIILSLGSNLGEFQPL